MGLNDAVEAIPRKTMVLFFLIDTSGSMGGSKIGAVNAAIEEVLPELRDLSGSNADAEVKIAALEFNNAALWITKDNPVKVDDFRWTYLDAAGSTCLGDACLQLNDKLSTKSFMREASGSFAPAIFLLSDGEPTDNFDGGLAELQKNNWFKAAIKVAVAIGDDANKTQLAKFTGSLESVLEVHNAAMLRKMIRFVSVRSSQVASKSMQIKTPIATPTAYQPTALGEAANAASVSSAPQAPAETGAKQQDLNEQLKEIAVEAASAGDDEW